RGAGQLGEHARAAAAAQAVTVEPLHEIHLVVNHQAAEPQVPYQNVCADAEHEVRDVELSRSGHGEDQVVDGAGWMEGGGRTADAERGQRREGHVRGDAVGAEPLTQPRDRSWQPGSGWCAPGHSDSGWAGGGPMVIGENEGASLAGNDSSDASSTTSRT